ncbi:L-aspartate oxidase [Candidatus Roizmanbacteria bacterium RIFCSPLOWO2_02_FULL_38_10]|uniref:L-aspartate oxidase n=1 Tax=Candidatus Roizmanbacteria bacterium RIFCSPLOWO2_02_FULL_38_10 TaxID=1802074 RepID=A0A1F7JP33_9BACT|nr:MAG: L-aspartate oxidase [Candidatus Roizmanbacteria bacterium RIFCSPLOWO2_02_FULL_38_10]
MENKYDVVIIGSGIAGLSSAITLSRKHIRVALLTKAKLSDSATTLAQGGIVSVRDQSDSYQKHITDTLNAGKKINDRKAVTILSHQSRNAIDFLEDCGVNFDQNDRHELITSLEAAHSVKRIVHASDFTGLHVENALIKQAKKNGVKLFPYTYCLDLIINRDQCQGVSVLNLASAKPRYQNYYCHHVILATGGLGQLYKFTTNPKVVTGDGIAIATRARVKISNLEFIQFHPTALYGEKSPLFLLSESLRGEGGRLVDASNTRLHSGNGDFLELIARDQLARIVYSQEQQKKEIFLLLGHLDCNFLKKRFPNITKELNKRGFDICRDLIPVVPAAHYSCGGVNTNLNGDTNIKGLHAVGEISNSGVHGANRLASNSLLEGVVFGRRTADNIISKISKRKNSLVTNDIKTIPLSDGRLKVVDKKKVKLTKRDLQKAIKIRQLLQDVMWEKVGIIRNENDLKTALREITLLQDRLQISDQKYQISGIKTSDLLFILETKNMLTVAKLIVQAALARKESLGCHYVTKAH